LVDLDRVLEAGLVFVVNVLLGEFDLVQPALLEPGDHVLMLREAAEAEALNAKVVDHFHSLSFLWDTGELESLKAE